MKRKRKTLSIDIAEPIYRVLERRGNVQEFMHQALEMLMFMDKALIRNSEKIADQFQKKHKVTSGDVISNSAIAFLALSDASIEVLGPGMDLMRKIFVFEKDEERDTLRLITGNKLYENLKENYVRRLREDLASIDDDLNNNNLNSNNE
jgi:reverse gyrase